MSDVIKAVVYDRGAATLEGETRHVSLVAMMVVSKERLALQEQTVLMGTADVSGELRKLVAYDAPYQMGEIGGAIIDISNLTPQDMEDRGLRL